MKVMRTAKAAILVEQRKPLVVAEIELPRSLDVGQVLVQVHYSGICGSQIGEIDGVKGADRFLPHLLGHEGSGIVQAVGPGVKHVKLGDKVVLHWRKGLGIESGTPEYQWKGHKVNAGWVTTFNEYAIVSENRCTPIPQGCGMDVAALFGCAVTTGFGVVQNNARLRIGESAVVYGAGGVGLNIVQAAAMVGAYPIIAVDQFDNRLALAKEMGATHCINATKQNAEFEIKKIAENQGVDVFIDNTGKPENIEMGYVCTKSQGRVILVGVPSQGSKSNIHTLPLHFGKKIIGSYGGESVPHEDIPRINAIYRLGRMSLDKLITSVIDLDEINEAIHSMRNGEIAGRCLIKLR